MRIVRGEFKGRHITAPSNLPVRPTTDFAKEGLFNVLENHIEFEGLKVLDLFSGTGNISYEFASRGAASVICVDIDWGCTNFIKKTYAGLDFKNGRVVKSDVFKFVKICKDSFDLIFADPPYALDKIPQIPHAVFENNLLKPGGWLIVEHDQFTDMSKHVKFVVKRNYGKVNFSFFQA